MSATHSDRIQALQRLAFKNFPELRELALANIASVDTRASLLRHLKELTDARYEHDKNFKNKTNKKQRELFGLPTYINTRLYELCVMLNLIPTQQEREEHTKVFLVKFILCHVWLVLCGVLCLM